MRRKLKPGISTARATKRFWRRMRLDFPKIPLFTIDDVFGGWTKGPVRFTSRMAACSIKSTSPADDRNIFFFFFFLKKKGGGGGERRELTLPIQRSYGRNPSAAQCPVSGCRSGSRCSICRRLF